MKIYSSSMLLKSTKNSTGCIMMREMGMGAEGDGLGQGGQLLIGHYCREALKKTCRT